MKFHTYFSPAHSHFLILVTHPLFRSCECARNKTFSLSLSFVFPALSSSSLSEWKIRTVMMKMRTLLVIIILTSIHPEIHLRAHTHIYSSMTVFIQTSHKNTNTRTHAHYIMHGDHCDRCKILVYKVHTSTHNPHILFQMRVSIHVRLFSFSFKFTKFVWIFEKSKTEWMKRTDNILIYRVLFFFVTGVIFSIKKGKK